MNKHGMDLVQIKSSRPKPLPVSSGGNDKMKDKKVDLATILFFIALIAVLFFGQYQLP
jgi:hypothetical protein